MYCIRSHRCPIISIPGIKLFFVYILFCLSRWVQVLFQSVIFYWDSFGVTTLIFYFWIFLYNMDTRSKPHPPFRYLLVYIWKSSLYLWYLMSFLLLFYVDLNCGFLNLLLTFYPNRPSLSLSPSPVYFTKFFTQVVEWSWVRRNVRGSSDGWTWVPRTDVRDSDLSYWNVLSSGTDKGLA